MSNQFIFIIMGIAVAGIVIMGILYYILQINIGFQRIENVEENVS